MDASLFLPFVRARGRASYNKKGPATVLSRAPLVRDLDGCGQHRADYARPIKSGKSPRSPNIVQSGPIVKLRGAFRTS
jgi:hypothetical protein